MDNAQVLLRRGEVCDFAFIHRRGGLIGERGGVARLTFAQVF